METIKNIIIGFGKGGKTLAKFLAQHGEQVLVVEKSKQMYGGTCINIACLPSKRLIIEAAHGTSFEDAVDGKNVMTAQLRQKNYQMLASEDNITVLDGTAHFTGNHTINVQTPDGKELTYKGERIFINTGATPSIPDIPGLKNSPFLLNSTDAMNQDKLPRELVIIGGGYIGLEFANMFASFGSRVTILDHHKSLLPREDDDVAEMVIQNFKDNGVKFEVGVNIKDISEQDEQAAITFTRGDNRETTIFADKILAATGRQPETASLDLQNTDIKVDKKGAIVVNDLLQTNVSNVWAIGDVKGGPQFTYISLDDFRIIKDELFGNKERRVSDRLIVPTNVFIEPSLAQVGLTEKEAQKQGKDYLLFKMPAAAIPKAKVLKDTRGLLKVLVDPQTNLIIGATLYIQEAQEIINMVVLAMRAKLPYQMLRDQIYTHPTISEAFNDLFKKPVNN
ncbi:FAD-dependent oxidoreductase [Limosilactobacillus caviae]|uniref:Pyridine nucleotide-disulfide oxidoreductase n=1 Tax=Limosilactobacillus caviae TaxID=1769424 RepID=A0ABQ2C687_9LACO|nr:FAD-dependent oxidoreductase [Limosilactobacillus caviae]MCD7124250.1 FAD-dependent oxidoreductase [Limosilactobacillus caviae]MRH46742.1 pyridine nucleotide-disulfide oxidoreductase [Limosilactobacillus reuteri]GGI63886.1 pyridine nucleotide-disulfide oxidoreductase [Limosilactobacillus caviae]